MPTPVNTDAVASIDAGAGDSTRRVRAVTHVHTRHSWDSRLDVARLCQRLRAGDIDLVLVNDHDSFAGSLELRRLVADQGLALTVPVAAEIRTDHGDVIVVVPDDDPPPVAALKRWTDLHRIVEERRGLIWLPHPLRSHTEIEQLAAGADVIEVFNARCTPDENARAAELCARHGKVPGYGHDAHLLSELGSWWVEYEAGDDPLNVLRQPPRCPDPRATRRSAIATAEAIDAVRRRRPRKLASYSLRYLRWRAQEVFGHG